MVDDDSELRAAAERMLSGSINSQRSSCTQHSVTRTPDIVLSADFVAGAMQNGRMSNVRRFFCLFVTFDLLLTFLIWLICTMIAGESLMTAFMDQIVHYHIKTSLFDIVMAAICRFTILLLFYALLYLNHWIIIALTTTGTCVFLIAKVFVFDWSTCNQPVFQFLLIIASFVLSWVEAWFFDFRVLPQETQAKQWLRNFIDTERAPLLRTAAPDERQYNSIEPVGNFFTPMDSPEHSDHEDDPIRRQGGSRRLSKTSEIFLPRCSQKLTVEKIDEYKRKAFTLMQKCHELLTSEFWKIECIMPNGDVICFMDRPKPEGRVLKIAGEVNAPAGILVDRLFEDIESLPLWNKLVMESVKLQQIDGDTDIVYQATSPQGGGIIGARDFVILRHRTQYDGYHISSGMSVPLASLPNRNNYVRGENGVSCWAARELPDEENKCHFTWILNTNLKGWLPQKIVDKSMSTALIDFMSYIRKYVDELELSST